MNNQILKNKFDSLKGWWKGELRGRIGLFPDNFVELIGPKTDQYDSQHDQSLYSNGKSSIRHSVTTKRTEKAHARRSLDVHNVPPQPSISSKTRDSNLPTDSRRPPSAAIHEQSTTVLDGSRKSSISTSSSSSSTSGLMPITGDKKSNGSQIMTSLKRLVGGGGNSNGNIPSGNTLGIDDELDGVQRGEGAPLSHPTASRARLPRRRLPSSQHLRHQNNSVNNATTPIVASHPVSFV